MPHYTDHTTFMEALLGFGQFAREYELNVGIRENQEALLTTLTGLWGADEAFRYALKSLFCKSPDEYPLFEELFRHYWQKEEPTARGKTTFKNQSNLQKRSKASVVMMGVGGEPAAQEEEASNTSGANAEEALRKTDFAKVSQINSALLESLAEQLWRQMSLRLKRKTKLGRKGRIHLQQTIRKNISSGGSMLKLIHRKKHLHKYRLVVLLDVSGSMDKYSFFLLKFIHTLRTNFENVEAFIFSTSLIRITDWLNKKDLDATLQLLGLHANNWSSGTKIGLCLKTFNDHHAKRVLNGRTLTILLSDGLDTGTPEMLQEQLEKMKLRTKKLVWLNPLKGMEGYEPIQRGMQAALPSLHHFGSAHSIDSLLALENLLIDA